MVFKSWRDGSAADAARKKQVHAEFQRLENIYLVPFSYELEQSAEQLHFSGGDVAYMLIAAACHLISAAYLPVAPEDRAGMLDRVWPGMRREVLKALEGTEDREWL